MKIHELLTPENIGLDFAPSPGQELKSLISLAGSRVRASSEATRRYQEDERHLINSYMSEGLAILHNLSEVVDEPLLVLALAPAGMMLDGHSCQVLAVLISPSKGSGSHFQLLAKLTSLLRNHPFREEMLAKRSGAEVLRAIKLQEESGHENYWVLSQEEILEELQTFATGLSQEEAAKRLAEVGENRIARVRHTPLILRLGANFVNLFALLLWAASGFAYLRGMVELAEAIPLVILINAVFSFWQEYRAEKAIEALGKLLPTQSRVLRSGAELEVDAAAIVPGDIIILEAGDQVPADARLIEAQDFRVDNSALTGESEPAYKFDAPVEDGQEFLWTEMPNLMFAGTAALSGAARGWLSPPAWIPSW